MTKFFAAAALVAGLLLAGCGVPPSPGSSAGPDATSTETQSTDEGTIEPSPDSSLAARLDGRAFETRDASDVRGFDLVADSKLTISFGVDPDGNPTMGAKAGCNGMGGAVSWDGDTVRPSEGFAHTEMACEGLIEQEDWYFALLNDGLTLKLDGDFLTATNADGTAEIIFVDSAVLHPNTPLAGYTWRLTGLTQGSGEAGTATSAPLNVTASMMISRDPKDGHFRLDVFDGLTWMAVPAGFDAAAGKYSGSVTIEPTTSGDSVDGDSEPLDATAGVVRVTEGLAGDAIECAADAPDCRVPEMTLLGNDFEFATHQNALTVTGLGDYAGRGLTFVVDPTAPTPDLDDYLPADVNPLLGKTFALTRTFTDAGGLDHKHADSRLILTFGADSVTADGSCGPFTYDAVRYIADPTDLEKLAYVELGRPSVAGCVLGDDPAGPPEGKLMYLGGDEVQLSTGFVIWFFKLAS